MKNKNVKFVEEIKKHRGIKVGTRILLFSQAGGRCQLCNELLIQDKITGEDINWAEIAHIYAFGEKGPRANKNYIDKNNINNLILSCPNCHEKIDKDKQVKYYSADYLQEIKKEHEKRIRLLTSFTSKEQTKVIKMVANIGKDEVRLTQWSMVEALMNSNLIPVEHDCEEIDFTSVHSLYNEIYWQSKIQEIDQKLERFYSSLRRSKNEHISVFAIGPIPLLVYLGFNLQDKIATRFFQRHRNGDSWLWKQKKATQNYTTNLLQEGEDKNKIALFLSLSGKINIKNIDPKIIKGHYLYEITINNPNVNFLKSEKDLQNFEEEFNNFMGKVETQHPDSTSIKFFPAIPAPISVVCGRSLNKNFGTALEIYNLDENKNYKYTITINNKNKI